MRFPLVLACASAALLASPAIAQEQDPYFKALEDELKRAQALRLGKGEAPYYLSATASDEESFSASASFGALLSRGSERRGSLAVSVRVGTPGLDNTNLGGDSAFGGLARGWAGSTPAEPDYDALRHALWLRFDAGYKKALEAIAKKRAFLETNQVKDRPADFAPAKVANVVLPREELRVDRDRWTRLVKRASAVFREYPRIYTGLASVRAAVGHQYFVSSDPARHRFAEPQIQLTLSASTQADDGMDLRVGWDLRARTEGELPSDEEVIKAARGVAERCEALAKAPAAIEDYSGPILFTGQAAGVFFLQTIGDPLSKPRDDLGEAQQGRLVERLGKHIASKLLWVRDDPTQAHWNGQPLLGHFPVDDDGVKPSPVSLVEAGVLKTYFMSRVPTKRVKESNGHSRAGQGSVGNLFVETKTPEPREVLKKRLIELAKEEDLEFGILIDELEEGNRYSGTSGNTVSLPAPSAVFRVYPDGREELVRGLAFKPTNFRILKDIVGMGDAPALLNTTQAGQRVSVVAPAVLVKLAELQKTREEYEKPPLTPRPPLARIVQSPRPTAAVAP